MIEIKIPTTCPTCNSTLERIKDQIFCNNSACEAKSSKKLVHFTKTMKIMGLGEKTLEKLELNGIPDLYALSQFDLVEKLGEKVGTKIYNELEKSKISNISTFITAMAIPLIGKSASDKVQQYITSLDQINEDICKKAGLGPKATETLMNWKNTEYENYITLPIQFNVSKPLETSKTVCISGKIPGYTKSEITNILSSNGILVKDSVTKDLDYLITVENNTTKVNKAKSYNINIISFDNFLKEIEE